MTFTLNIGASKEEIDLLNQKLIKANLRHRKGLDAKKFCGVIHLKHDPLTIQKTLRNEWE